MYYISYMRLGNWESYVFLFLISLATCYDLRNTEKVEQESWDMRIYLGILKYAVYNMGNVKCLIKTLNIKRRFRIPCIKWK